jgi:hypothetical protein
VQAGQWWGWVSWQRVASSTGIGLLLRLAAPASSVLLSARHRGAGLALRKKDYHGKTTMESVRHYTTNRIKDGTMFTCTHCEHSVTTLDFHKETGNLRTQAATAINLHAAAVHGQPVLISAPDSQHRIWRT